MNVDSPGLPPEIPGKTGQDNNYLFEKDKKSLIQPPRPKKTRKDFKQIEQIKPKRRLIFPKMGCSIKSILTGGCFTLLVLIIGLLLIVLFKPDSIWSRTVRFLNADLEIYEFNGTSYEIAINDINRQIESVGDNTVIIDEHQMTALSRHNIPHLDSILIDIEEGKFTIYWVMDQKIKDEPLYGLMEFRKNDEKEIYINKFGTQRIGTPKFINSYLNDIFFSLLSLGEDEEVDYMIIDKLISLNESNSITSLEFQEGQLVLTVNVDVNLFN